MPFLADQFGVVADQNTNVNVLDIAQQPPNIYRYKNLSDTIATGSASGYFNYFAQNVNTTSNPRVRLQVGDWIMASFSDGAVTLRVTAITPNVTVSSDVVPVGSIVNADIAANAAIAVSKLEALATGEIIVGNAGVPTVAAMSGDATIAANGAVTLANDSVDNAQIVDGAVTTAKLDPSTIQYAVVTVSAAEIIGMYAAPKLLVAAAGANTTHRVRDVLIEVDYGGAQFTGGGAIAVQYDSTINGAGTAASATLAAATLNGYTADSTVGLAGAAASAAGTTTVNKGLYLSNDTGAFATGTSTVYVHLWYSTVSTNI